MTGRARKKNFIARYSMKKLNCVLLVDDDGATNFINYRIVKQLDITEEIHTEFNGEKALNYIQYYAERHDNHGPELILLDLKMPVLDGYEFMEYLRLKKFSNKDKMSVLVLSSGGGKDDMERLLRHNVRYIAKPLTAECLTEALGIKHCL